MRGKKSVKQVIPPDPVYDNVQVSKFINHVMRRGAKSLARRIVYSAFDIVKEKTEKEALEIFEKAITNTSPLLEVRPRRIGGATYQVPIEVKGDRRSSLAMRWIIEAAKSRKGRPMREKLAQELIDASKNTGVAVRKKENIRKVAEANRAFAHFAW